MNRNMLHPISTKTTNGEIKIHLTLDINVNTGKIEVSASDKPKEEILEKEPKDKDIWMIPDFNNLPEIQ